MIDVTDNNNIIYMGDESTNGIPLEIYLIGKKS